MRHKRMGKKSKGLFRIGDQVEVRFLNEGLKGTWHSGEESDGSSLLIDHIPMSGSLPFLCSDSSSSSKNKRPRIRALYPPLSAPPSHENLFLASEGWPLMTCLEKIQKKGSFISLNQLWCQLSMKREFMQVVLEWTCTSNLTWEMLIDQVIGYAERERTEKQMRVLWMMKKAWWPWNEYDSDVGQVEEPTLPFPSYSTDELFSEYDPEHHSIDPGQVEEPTFQFPSYWTDELFSKYNSEHHWIDGGQEQESTYRFSSQSTHGDYSEREEQKEQKGCGKVTKRERQSHHYSYSITDYIEVRNNNGSRRGRGLIKHMKQKAVNHLLSARWKLECKVCDKRYAFRYVSVNGKAYYALLQACMPYQEAGLSQNSIKRSSSTEDILSTGSTMTKFIY
ncbi:hypothetical protein AMTRI_Chr13g116260 [Amborella trichopoda]